MVKFTSILDNCHFEISLSFERYTQTLLIITPEIGKVITEQKKYIIESIVHKEVLQNFIDYWETEKLPEINDENIYEYFLLSQEFGLMKDLIQLNHEEIELQCLIYILSNNISNSKPKIPFDKSKHENYIAEHLDVFLENYSEKMYKISINSLCNIFFNSKRNLIDQNKAYKFINNFPKPNPNYTGHYILFSSLNESQLNDENIEDSFIHQRDHFNFHPQRDPNKIFEDRKKLNHLEELTQLLISEQKSSLLNAIENENIKLIQFLLDRSEIDINYKTNKIKIEEDKEIIEDVTALYAAIEKGNTEIVQLLLSRKDIDINDKYIKKTNINLYERGEIKSIIEEKTILQIAIENENIEIVQLLLEHPKIDVNDICIKTTEIENEGRRLKIENKVIDIVEIIESRCSIFYEKETKTALFIAIENQNIEIIDILLSQKNIDINDKFEIRTEKKINYPFINIKKDLYYFLNRNHTTIVEQKTALQFAIEKEDVNIVKRLLNQPNLNINTEYYKIFDYYDLSLNQSEFRTEKKSALHLSVDKGNEDIVQLLLSQQKIDLNCLSMILLRKRGEDDIMDQKTAFYTAIENGNAKIVQLFLSQPQIDINHKYVKSTAIVKDNGSDESRISMHLEPGKTIIEKTPLHMAVEKRNEDLIVSLLNKEEINTDTKNEKGQIPIELTNDENIKKLFNK